MAGIKDILISRKQRKAETKVNASVSTLKSFGVGYSLTDGIVGGINHLSKRSQKKIQKAASTMGSYGAGYYPTRNNKINADSFSGVANHYTPLKNENYAFCQEKTKRLSESSIYNGAGAGFLTRACYDAKIQSTVDKRRLKLNPLEKQDLTSIIESEFKLDRESKDFDYTKENNFSQLADVALKDYLNVGEFFAILRQNVSLESGVSVQLFSPFQISNPVFSINCKITYCDDNGCDMIVNASSYGTLLKNGSYIRNGIEYTKKGEKKAIFIAPSAGSYTWTRLAIYNNKGFKQVIHGFIQNETGQGRGISESVKSWHEFMNIADLEKFELESAKINATIAGTVTSDSNSDPDGNTPLDDLGKVSKNSITWGNDETDAVEELNSLDANYSVREVDGGGFIVQNFTPGYKYQSNDTTRPNVSVPNFIEKILEFALPSTYGVSVVCAKYRFDGSYNASKGAIDLTWKNGIEYTLKNFKSDFYNPIFSAWFEAKVAKGLITAPNYYENRVAYESFNVITPTKPSLNPLAEAKAGRENNAAGFSTIDFESQKLTGMSSVETMERLKFENKILNETKISEGSDNE